MRVRSLALGYVAARCYCVQGRYTTTRHRARISAPARVTFWRVRPIDGFQRPRGISAMPYDWPEETDFASWELDVLDRDCPVCGRRMRVCDHRYRRFHT